MIQTAPLDLYRAGRLQDALAATTDNVRRCPADQSARWFLSELYCFSGEYDRADRQLEMLAQQAPGSAAAVTLFRQLIRAEQARQQFYARGHLPELLQPPSPRLRLHLEASRLLREGLAEEAADLLAQAELQRPRLTGTCDGQPFEGLRDLDELSSSFFEVLTGRGKYYWVPMEHVGSVELEPHIRPRDRLWRRAHLSVRGGPRGDVYLPALYPRAHVEDEERFRLGQMTEWRGGGALPVRGVGQRRLLVGEEDRPFLELRSITIDPPDGP